MMWVVYVPLAGDRLWNRILQWRWRLHNRIFNQVSEMLVAGCSTFWDLLPWAPTQTGSHAASPFSSGLKVNRVRRPVLLDWDSECLSRAGPRLSVQLARSPCYFVQSCHHVVATSVHDVCLTM